ncbi:MAG: single-stranded DNA-binding protein [Thermodesulfobacteriota bacterium]|nr:single-stranded DNA-binding protein [Thermodesulfobacteriota bacterium]
MTLLNHVSLTGRVTNVPRFQYQPDGTPVLQFPLELNGSKDLDRKGDRSLIHIVAFGKLAEIRHEFRSGQRLLVKGRLLQRRWQTPEGRNQTRTEVIASELHPLEEETNLRDQDETSEPR